MGRAQAVLSRATGQLLCLMPSGRLSPLILTTAGWHDRRVFITPFQSNQWGSQETRREWEPFGEEQARVVDRGSSHTGNF